MYRGFVLAAAASCSSPGLGLFAACHSPSLNLFSVISPSCSVNKKPKKLLKKQRKHCALFIVHCFFVLFVIVCFNDAGNLFEKTGISFKMRHVRIYVRSMQLNVRRQV